MNDTDLQQNKFLDFYLKNFENFRSLLLKEILGKWSYLNYKDNIIEKELNFVVSRKQSDNKTYFFFDPFFVFNKYETEVEIIIHKYWNQKKENETRNQKQIKISGNNISKRKYKIICDSCNKVEYRQQKDLLRIVRDNNFVCKNCKNTVSHRLDSYKKKYYKNTENNSLRSSIIEKTFIDELLKVYPNSNKLFYYKTKQFFIDSKNRRMWLDFYDKERKIAIEIHGDFWHGNLKIFDPNKNHPMKKITYKELYKDTITRDNLIRNHAYI